MVEPLDPRFDNKALITQNLVRVFRPWCIGDDTKKDNVVVRDGGCIWGYCGIVASNYYVFLEIS